MTDQVETAERPPPETEGEALRAEVRAVMAEEGRSQVAVAREADVGGSTFNAWLGGKYTGNEAGVAGKVRRWLSARSRGAARRSVLPRAPGFVQTPSSEMFMGALEHAQHAPDMALIVGAPGVGKTMSALEYQRRSPSVWMLTAEPCFATPRMMLDALSETFAVTESTSGQKISRAIVTRVRGTGGLLIVDEAQHLTSASLDQLRVVHDMGEIGVALVGNDGVHLRIEGFARSAHHAQLFSRIGMRAPRAKPVKGDINALLGAWGVEGAEERALLHVIGQKPGALRGMSKCLRVAHMLASADDRLEAGAPAPTAAHIRAAWQQLAAVSLSDAP